MNSIENFYIIVPTKMLIHRITPITSHLHITQCTMTIPDKRTKRWSKRVMFTAQQFALNQTVVHTNLCASVVSPKDSFLSHKIQSCRTKPIFVIYRSKCKEPMRFVASFPINVWIATKVLWTHCLKCQKKLQKSWNHQQNPRWTVMQNKLVNSCISVISSVPVNPFSLRTMY